MRREYPFRPVREKGAGRPYLRMFPVNDGVQTLRNPLSARPFRPYPPPPRVSIGNLGNDWAEHLKSIAGEKNTETGPARIGRSWPDDTPPLPQAIPCFELESISLPIVGASMQNRSEERRRGIERAKARRERRSRIILEHNLAQEDKIRKQAGMLRRQNEELKALKDERDFYRSERDFYREYARQLAPHSPLPLRPPSPQGFQEAERAGDIHHLPQTYTLGTGWLYGDRDR